MNNNGKTMRLKIEQGFLLKPYLAPYTRKGGGGHALRQGWTPERTPELQALYEKIKAEAGDMPDLLVWKQAELEHGKQLVKLRRPYPGWFPVRPQSDRDIVRAYGALFVRMNPDVENRVKVGEVWSGEPARYPPDGDYVYEGGVMSPVTDEHGLTAQDVSSAVGEIAGRMLGGGARKITNG